MSRPSECLACVCVPVARSNRALGARDKARSVCATRAHCAHDPRAAGHCVVHYLGHCVDTVPESQLKNKKKRPPGFGFHSVVSEPWYMNT